MSIEVADTPSALVEAQTLRHQVFCLERGIFASQAGQTSESDAFDQRSRHIVIRNSEAEVIATARVVGGSSDHHFTCLPMQRYCSPALFRCMPMDTVGEISRFAISKQFRRRVSAAGPLIRLGLLQGILRVSREMGLTHWCALMEPSLLRLLSATGVDFAPLGPMVEASGQRQPSITAIDFTLAHGRRQRPDYYHLVSSGVSKQAVARDPVPTDARSRLVPALASPAAAEHTERGERAGEHRERRRLRS